MKNTALTHIHEKFGAKMTSFAGYNMPLEYSGIINEHMTVRNSVGMFDVSHMGEFWVKGQGALELLQYITTNDVSLLKVGHAQYSCLPNGEGGIVDDLIIYHYEESKYLAVVNASNMEKDWEWFNRHNTFGAELENASDSMSLIAIQGPNAQATLQKLMNEDLSALSSFDFYTTQVSSASTVIVSATGYTGSGGFELYCYNNDAEGLWNDLLKAGEEFDIQPIGLAARDTLRLEKGFCLYGNDIDDTTSPIEAGLGWVVKFADGKSCIDSDLLKKQKKEGVDKKLIGVELTGRGIPRHGYVLVDEDGSEIGNITSGTMSPMLKKGIGMAYIKTEFAKPGNKVYLQVRNKTIEAKVVKFPFV